MKRVDSVRFRFPCSFSVPDEELCKCYLYHLVVKKYGLFNDVPILHLPHHDLPLVQPYRWIGPLSVFYMDNQATIYILTDGPFEFPDQHWVRRGRTYGPVFCDTRLKFHGTRYVYRDGMDWEERQLRVDVFTASPVRRSANPNMFDFRFRALKIHNPQVFNYRARVGPRRPVHLTTGPYGSDPDLLRGPTTRDDEI